MSASLERRYRAALDWYPAEWRHANADAMLDTLLDEAEATGRVKPAPAQTLNLLAFAARERIRTAMPVAVRDRSSALAWGVGAAISVVMFVCIEWAPWPTADPRVLPPGVGLGPFMSATTVVLGLWAASFLAALVGAGTIARWILAATLPASLALVLFDTQPWAALRAPSSSLLFLALMALIALQGSPAATARGRAWLAVCAIGATGFVLPGVVHAAATRVSDDSWISRIAWADVTRPLYWGAALLGVALVAAIARRLTWSAAALVAVVPSLLFFAALLVASGGAVILAVAIGVATAAVVLVRRSGYRVVVQRRE